MLEELNKKMLLKDLILSEPIKNSQMVFDPRVKMSSQDWQLMGLSLDNLATETYLEDNGYDDYCDLAIAIQTLSNAAHQPFPRQYPEDLFSYYNQSLDDQRERITYTNFDMAEEGAVIYALTEGLYYLKRLFPKDFNKVNAQMESDETIILNEVDQTFASLDPDGFSFFALCHRFLYPSNNSKLNLEDADFNDLQKFIQELAKNKEYKKLATIAMRTRLLFPQKSPNEIISSTNLEKIFYICNDTDFINTYIPIAEALTIVTAEKVIITENGLEITLPSQKLSLTPTTKSLPIRRKF